MFRRLLCVPLMAVTLAACSQARRQKLEDISPPMQRARTFTVIGNWVLATPPDSTAFAGAQNVLLSLTSTSFILTANYPGKPPFIISGDADAKPEGGLITLTPRQTIQDGRVVDPNPEFIAGRPVTVIATAAGPSMVFAHQDNPKLPTSIWARPAEAEAAGIIKSAKDTMPPRKP
ncbi:MAG: hypothetical protein M3068_04970 [Gemmatimonadota bacterium]|nr:hypothetical protein [Gemmatimonadota bacterium]